MISAILLRSVTTLSDPPPNWDTPPTATAAARRARTIVSKVSATLFVNLLETPSQPSSGCDRTDEIVYEEARK